MQGGLAMALEDFTWPLACSGIALAIFAMTMYHRLVKWIGPIWLCRVGLLAGVLPALILPLASLFTFNKAISLVSHNLPSLTSQFLFLPISLPATPL